MKKLIISLTLCSSSWLYADSYTVEQGDTLSEIAQEKFGGPVFGTQGTLKQLLELNPEVDPGKYIYPGQTLKISDQSGAPVVDNTQQASEPPPPEPAPAPPQEPPQEDEKTVFVALVHGHASNLSLEAEFDADSATTSSTSQGTGGRVELGTHWPSFGIRIFGESLGYNVSDVSIAQTHFGLTGQAFLGRFSPFVSVGSGDGFFYIRDGSNFEVGKNSQTFASVGSGIDITAIGSGMLMTQLELFQYLQKETDTITSNSFTKYKVFLGYHYPFSWATLHTGLGYENSSLETNDQTVTDTTTRFVLGLDFDWEI